MDPARPVPAVPETLPAGHATGDVTLPAAPVIDPRIADTARADAGAAPESVLDASTLGPYRLVRMIGKGGMGAVWEAVDTRLGRRVAIKVIRSGADAHQEEIERFRREAANAGKLRHPNIVPVHDVGRDSGRDYLVMDLVEGDTLAEVLRHRQLTYREKATILATVARAVHYAHELGVVHRDLKPSNVMIERRGGSGSDADQHRTAGTLPVAPAAVQAAIGEPLVMDFGLAKDLESDSSLSRSGQAMGTPAYMPPEQAEGRLLDIGPRSDVYSLGAMLYEMLAGRPPFIGENVVQVLRAAVAQDPQPPRQAVPSVPRDLETICLTCLEKKPERRYASAAALAADLTAWLAGDHIAARPPTAADRVAKRVRRNPVAYALGVFSLALLVGGIPTLIYWIEQDRRLEIRAREQAEQAVKVINDEQTRRRLLEERTATEQRRDWRLVASDDFTDAAATAAKWQIIDGAGEVDAGEFHSSKACLLRLKRPVLGDVRVEWDARFEGPAIDSLCCLIGEAVGDGSWLGGITGYSFNVGSFDNTLNFIGRGSAHLVEARSPMLEPGRAYHARAEHRGSKLTFALDDVVILEAVDPLPLAGAQRDSVVLATWHCDARWSHVRVSTLGVPLKADLVDIAEDFLSQGRATTARDLFERVIDSSSDPTRVDQARRGKRAAEKMATQQELTEAASRRIRELWPTAVIKVCEDPGHLDVDLHNLPIADAEPLRGMPIERLFISSAGVSDLSPLRGMPLTMLGCENTPVASLEPLRGMPIRELWIAGTRVSDLSPLAGMPLRRLNCSKTPITDLSSLRGAPLEQLDIGETAIGSLEGVRGLRLNELRCTSNGITDLEPLRGMATLRSLDCYHNRIASLEPLRGLALSYLYCSENQIVELSPLRGMPLINLYCESNHVTTLAPLGDTSLRDLRCADNPIVDFGSFIAHPPRFLGHDFLGLDDSQLSTLAAGWEKPAPLLALAAETQRRLLVRDVAGLRALATESRGHRYLFLPRFESWAACEALCQELGGHLATIGDPADLATILSLLSSSDAWVGFRREAGGRITSVDGTPIDFASSHCRRFDGEVGTMLVGSDGACLSTWDATLPLPAVIRWDR